MSNDSEHERHERLAGEVAKLLERNDLRLVLAESCTSGRIASVLGLVPGISQHFCGSAVVYREETKIEWLSVDRNSIETETAVSAVVTGQIAENVLRKTPEANVALGITGHFGPNSPDGLDGTVFVSVWLRQESQVVRVRDDRWQLETKKRRSRQSEATTFALSCLSDLLADKSLFP